VVWIGKNHIHILDPCHLITWLCPELCQDAPISFTSTMDMLHPDYTPPGAWHMVGPDEGMVFCELTGSDRVGPPAFVSAERFLMRSWQQVAFTNDYMQYMDRLCLVKIPDQEEAAEERAALERNIANSEGRHEDAGGITAERTWYTDEHIAGEHKAIVEMLKRNKPAAMEVYFRSQVPSRWPEEEAPAPDASKEAA
jgi:hypothetical protein